MRKPFNGRAYLPLRNRQRLHTVFRYWLLAESEAEAMEALRERVPDALVYKVTPAIDDGGVLLFVEQPWVATPEEVRKLLGQPEPPPKVSKLNPATKRPLGEVQLSMLRGLVEHKGWSLGCGWLWDTRSNTKRILDGLCRRGLVNRQGTKYTINDNGREALKVKK